MSVHHHGQGAQPFRDTSLGVTVPLLALSSWSRMLSDGNGVEVTSAFPWQILAAQPRAAQCLLSMRSAQPHAWWWKRSEVWLLKGHSCNGVLSRCIVAGSRQELSLVEALELGKAVKVPLLTACLEHF